MILLGLSLLVFLISFPFQWKMFHSYTRIMIIIFLYSALLYTNYNESGIGIYNSLWVIQDINSGGESLGILFLGILFLGIHSIILFLGILFLGIHSIILFLGILTSTLLSGYNTYKLRAILSMSVLGMIIILLYSSESGIGIYNDLAKNNPLIYNGFFLSFLRKKSKNNNDDNIYKFLGISILKSSKTGKFIKGLIIGYKMPILPKKVLNFHENPIVRILRVIGGVSLIIWLGKYYEDYNLLFLPIAMLHLIYIMIISLIKLIYIIILWKNGKLDVWNSPIDKLSSLAVKLSTCVKGVCQSGLTVGTALGLGITIDEILVLSGRDRVFMPLISNMTDNSLNKLGFENPNKDIVNLKDKIKELKYRSNNYNRFIKDIDEINSVENSELMNRIKEDLTKIKNKEEEKIKILENSILDKIRKYHDNKKGND